MNDEIVQDTLFADPVGLRLRHAREKERLSKEAVAQQLKFPVAVVEAIEREDWQRLGAPIFVRSYISSYARLLGLPATLAEEAVRDKAAPALVAVGTGSPARRLFDRGLMNLAYLVMTVAIAGLVIALAMHFQSESPSTPIPALSLDAPVPDRTVMASLTPSLPTPISSLAAVAASPVPAAPIADANAKELLLYFRGQSWIDAKGPGGLQLERGLVAAGSERRYRMDQVSRIVLGDADQVDASLGAAKLDLAPFRDGDDAKVARFAVSSDGVLVNLDH